MRKTKFVILILMVLIGGFVLIRLWINLKDEKVVGKREEVAKVSNESADMSLEKIRLVEDKRGRKIWELEAKSAQQNNDQNVMILQEPKVTYYTEEGRTLVVTGRQGKIHQNSKDME